MLYEILHKKLTKTERIDLLIDYFSIYIFINISIYCVVFVSIMSYMYYSISFVMTKSIISNIFYFSIIFSVFTYITASYLDYKEKKEKVKKTELNRHVRNN